jgi:broad-specificity NMP kinase
LKKLIVAITGTPGTGKSTFAKKLAERLDSCRIIEINDVVHQHRLYSRSDRFGSKVVRMKELKSAMEEEIKKTNARVVIVVGHLVPDLRLNFDIIIVLRTGLMELAGRLKKRAYPKGKIRENLISEATDYCGVLSRESCNSTYEAESDSERRMMISYVHDVSAGIRTKEPKKRWIEKLHELLDLIKEGNEYGL